MCSAAERGGKQAEAVTNRLLPCACAPCLDTSPPSSSPQTSTSSFGRAPRLPQWPDSPPPAAAAGTPPPNKKQEHAARSRPRPATLSTRHIFLCSFFLNFTRHVVCAQSYTRALQLCPGLLYCLVQTGVLHYHQGAFHESEQAFDRCARPCWC